MQAQLGMDADAGGLGTRSGAEAPLSLGSTLPSAPPLGLAPRAPAPVLLSRGGGGRGPLGALGVGGLAAGGAPKAIMKLKNEAPRPVTAAAAAILKRKGAPGGVAGDLTAVYDGKLQLAGQPGPDDGTAAADGDIGPGLVGDRDGTAAKKPRAKAPEPEVGEVEAIMGRQGIGALTVPQLKAWLKSRRLTVGGKKEELMARVTENLGKPRALTVP